MSYTVSTIKDLIRLGGNLIITGSYTPDSLRDFVRLANTNKVHLIIRSNDYSLGTLKDLIRIAEGNLTIEL